jgi:hypothetical protein
MKLASIVFASLFILPTAAFAQQKQTAEQPADDSGEHLSGLEIMVRPTIGGAGASSPVHVAPGARTVGDVPSVLQGSSPYGTGFGVGGEIGFRFHPVFAMGLRADLSQISSTNPDGITELSRSRQTAGLYARGYPLSLSPSIRKYVDPWAMVGVSYVHDGQSFHHPAATTLGTSVDASWQLDQHAIGVPIGIGVDYRVTKAISIGPSFVYTILAPIAGCAKQSASGFQDNKLCTDSSGAQALAQDATGSWNVGLDLRFTPFK